MTEVRPIPSDLSDRTLTLNLTIHDAETISIRSCEVMGRGFRNRVSFNEHRQIEEVMVARFSKAIKCCLQGLPDGAHVLSLPDFLLEVPGLAVCGVHLMVMEAKEGLRNAILRFKEFIGAVNNAFSNDIGFHEPYPSYTEKLAVNVLADVCLPILNLCRAFEELKFGQDRGHVLDISDKAREFEFQTELLKRFIFNAGLQQAEHGSYLEQRSPQRTKRLTLD